MEDWMPTNDLRWFSDTRRQEDRRLQQKWIKGETEEEWRDVPLFWQRPEEKPPRQPGSLPAGTEVN